MFSRSGPDGISVPFAVQPTPATPIPFYQNDQPNPLGYLPGVISNRDTTIGVQSSAPSVLNSIFPIGQPSNIGWGDNPKGYLNVITNWYITSGVQGSSPSLLNSIDGVRRRNAFVTKYEKRNYDVAKRSQSEQVNTNVLLPFPNLSIQSLRPFDWPNPKGYRNDVGYKSQAEQVNTNTLLPQPNVITPALYPLDWPVPKGYTPSIALRTWVVNGVLLYSTPFRQLEWPVPKGPLQFNRSYEFSVNLNLIGKDQTFGLGGYPKFDWPNPKGPKNEVGYKSQAEQVNTTLLPIPPIVASPFNQTDWPNPVFKYAGRHYLELLGNVEEKLVLYVDTFGPFDGKGGRQLTPPNPLGYKSEVSYKSQIEQINLALLVPTSTQINRGPLVTKYEKRLELHQSVLAQPIIDTIGILTSVKPFYQNDWPVPKGSYYYQKEFFEPAIALLPTPAAPLKAANWPNPVLRTQSVIDHKTHSTQNILITLLPPVTPAIYRLPLKFAPWRVDSRVAENTTPLQNTITLLTALIPQIPNRPIEWPNPILRKDALTYRSYTYSPNIFLIGQDTFFGDPGEVPGFTWPQPRVEDRANQRGSLGNSSFNLLTSPTIKPFASFTWPDKIIPREFNERTWLINLQQTTLHFTPVLVFLNSKSWAWNGNAGLLTFNVPVPSKSWIWQPQAPVEKQTLIFQRAWNWSGAVFGTNLVIPFALKAWNWATNSFNLPLTFQFLSKSWQWRANPVFSFGTGLFRKLLMLLGVGQ